MAENAIRVYMEVLQEKTAALIWARPRTKRMKRLTDLLISARRFSTSQNFCTSFLLSLVPGVSLLSARRFTSSYLGD